MRRYHQHVVLSHCTQICDYYVWFEHHYLFHFLALFLWEHFCHPVNKILRGGYSPKVKKDHESFVRPVEGTHRDPELRGMVDMFSDSR